MHDICCTEPRSCYPWSTIYAKMCLVTLLPWIWKPSFGSSFSSLSHWFNISSSQNAQKASPYTWRSQKRDCINYMQLTTFIIQNWFIYPIRRCAHCMMNMGKDEFHSYTEEGFFIIQCSDKFWGGDCTEHRHAQKRFLVVSHEGAELQRTLWLSGCLSLCIPPCAPIEEPNGSRAEFSEQFCEARHHKDSTPAQQADLGSSSRAPKLIYCFMGIMVAISFHCFLTLRATPQLIATMQASIFNTRWLEKSSLLHKMKMKVKVMTLDGTTSNIAVHGQEGTVSPQLIRMICFS